MRAALAYLRSEAAARSGSVLFVFLVSWAVGMKAGQGLSADQWVAAAAAVAGALLVAILVHGPAAVFGARQRR